MTRLLYLTARFPSAPGEAFLGSEVEALAALGVELHVVPCVRHTGPVPDGRWCDACGEVVRIDPARAWVGALRHPARAMRVLSSAAPAAVRERTKLALRGTLRSSVALELAERFAGQVDHVHAHWADTPATVAMAAARLLDVPWSFTAHRGDIVMANDLARKVVSAAFVHCISEQGRMMLLERLPDRLPARVPDRSVSSGGPRAKIAVRHLGVRVPPGPPVELDPNADVPVLVCPAQLKPVKGHRHLLDAMALLHAHGSRCRLVICGDGDLLHELRSQTSRLGLEGCVEFMGDVAQPELFRMYRSGHVRAVVLPSVDLGGDEHEGIPVSLMEAMVHGLPVVSTTTGAIPELVADPAIGTLVAPGDADALAGAIGAFVDDVALAARVGASASAHVRSGWSAEASARSLVEAIQRTT